MTWDLVALGVDTVAAVGFYLAYKGYTKEYHQIKECPDFNVGPELKNFLLKCPENNIAYGSVTGYTTTQDTPIKSHYDKTEEGVIQRLTLLEHRTKRIQGHWSDADRTIRNNLNLVPFELAEYKDGRGVKVEVNEPLEADNILESMKTTYDKFEPTKTSVVERSMERLFGEVSKGFQEKEKMLGLGARLMGIGRLVMENNQIRIEPPHDGRVYMLTTKTKNEVLKGIESTAGILKNLAMVCGVISIGYITYLAYQKYKQWRNRREMQRIINEVRAARQGQNNENDDSQMCVICLSNPREVVMLDCGHICSCLSCAESLPNPKLCPVCRQNVNRIIPVYVS